MIGRSCRNLARAAFSPASSRVLPGAAGRFSAQTRGASWFATDNAGSNRKKKVVAKQDAVDANTAVTHIAYGWKTKNRNLRFEAPKSLFLVIFSCFLINFCIKV
jgi:hypothetical protein